MLCRDNNFVKQNNTEQQLTDKILYLIKYNYKQQYLLLI